MINLQFVENAILTCSSSWRILGRFSWKLRRPVSNLYYKLHFTVCQLFSVIDKSKIRRKLFCIQSLLHIYHPSYDANGKFCHQSWLWHIIMIFSLPLIQNVIEMIHLSENATECFISQTLIMDISHILRLKGFLTFIAYQSKSKSSHFLATFCIRNKNSIYLFS